MSVEISTRLFGAVTVVELAGRLTLGNPTKDTEDRVKALIAGGSVRVVVDLAKLDFADSAGIGTMVACAGAAMEAGAQLRYAGANDRVKQVLKMTRVDKILSLHPNLDAALKDF